jgi:hypothetical protein
MGLISVPSLVLLQEIVGPAERGGVTASNIFSRNLGSTLGATLLGAVLNHGLSLAGTPGPITSDQLRLLLDTHSLAAGDVAIRLALEQALNLTFWAVLALSVGTMLLAFLVPSTAVNLTDLKSSVEVKLD